MANRVTDIITRFTLQGLTATRTTMRSIETGMRDMASRASATTTDLARRAGAAVKRQFANVVEGSVAQASKRLDQANKGLIALATATKNVGFSALEKSAKTTFLAIGAAASAAALKVAAAIKVTKDSATELSNDDLRRQQTGVSLSDQQALKYASEKQGTGKDDLINALQGVSNTIRELERGKSLNNDAAARGNSFLRTILPFARRAGDAESLQTVISQSQSAGMANLDSVEWRMKRMEALIRSVQRGRIASMLDQRYIKNGADEAGIAEFRRQQSAMLTPLIVQYQQLTEASKSLREAMGPAGRALEDLKDVGMNAEVVQKGGVDALAEVADALQKFDPERQKELVRGLFGDLTHLPVLRGGREGVMRDQLENERYSGKVTDEDGERSSRLKAAELARNRSIEGFKLTTARLLSPLLEESNRQFADWLADNRARIAVWVKDTFVAVRKVVYDIGRLFEGKNDFESGLFRMGVAVIDWGKKTYAIIKTTITESYEYVSAKVNEVREELGKVFEGKASKWEWLNRIVDALTYVKAIWTDLVAILNGEDAVTMTWLNDARDAVADFMAHVKEAWEMFRKVLDSIHSLVKPILNFFNTDILTAALFLGMLRLSGILGGILGTARLLLPAFGTLFAGMGIAAAGVATQVGLIAAALYAAWKGGEWLGGKLAEPIVNGHSKLSDAYAETMKIRDRKYMQDKLDRATPDQRIALQQGMYGHAYGQATAAQKAQGYARHWEKSRANGTMPVVGSVNDKSVSDAEKILAQDRLFGTKNGEQKSVKINLVVGGKEHEGFFQEDTGARLYRELMQAQRNGT